MQSFRVLHPTKFCFHFITLCFCLDNYFLLFTCDNVSFFVYLISCRRVFIFVAIGVLEQLIQVATEVSSITSVHYKRCLTHKFQLLVHI